MTRFFVKIECEDIAKRLIRYCEKENYVYRVNEFSVVSKEDTEYKNKLDSSTKRHNDIINYL